jgi:type III secretory pathway component EscS
MVKLLMIVIRVVVTRGVTDGTLLNFATVDFSDIVPQYGCLLFSSLNSCAFYLEP